MPSPALRPLRDGVVVECPVWHGCRVMVRLLLILAVLLTASCSDPRSQVTASPKNEISCTDMTFEGDGTPEEVRAAVPEDGWRGELAFSSCRERVSTPPRWGCALPEEDVANDLKMTSFICCVCYLFNRYWVKAKHKVLISFCNVFTRFCSWDVLKTGVISWIVNS